MVSHERGACARRRRGRATAAALLAAGWVLAVAASAAAAPAAAPAGIVFSPLGDAKQVRQVVARFSAPMVALGDPRATLAPFAIACPPEGTARWIDARTWTYEFGRQLPAGVRCTFTLVDGVRTLAGAPVTAPAPFAFSTGGPSLTGTTPSATYGTIEEDQVFILRLDAAPTEESVRAHVGFAVAGLPERVGVEILPAEERAAVLKTAPWAAQEPLVVLRAQQRFPHDARVRLVWGAGVATVPAAGAAAGVATARDQVLEFTVRKALAVRFTCERPRRDAGCMPVTPMRLEFTAGIPWAQASRITLTGPDGRARTPEAASSDAAVVSSVTFPGPFPEESAFTIALPDGLADEAGRFPVNADRYPLEVRTGGFPPLAKFAARFGIIERHADPTLPVTLRNLEPEARARILDVTAPLAGTVLRIPPEREVDVLPWLRRVGTARRERSVFAPAPAPTPSKGGAAGPTEAPTVSPSPTASAPTPLPGGTPVAFTLPKPGGERAFEVVGLPLREPGLYVVELESARLGTALLAKPGPMYVPTAALVTNLSVHLKWGEQASLAWVTTLDTATPVPDAQVTVRDCTGTPVFEGRTDAQGIARIPHLPRAADLPTCYGPAGYPEMDPFDGSQTRALRELWSGLLVVARTADDMSFVHSSWEEGIEPWRFDLPDEPWNGRFSVHTILDRALVRAGEVVHMKHLFRAQTLAGFGAAPADRVPNQLVLRHSGSGQEYPQALAFDAGGVAESVWPIPAEAKLGRYEIVLRRTTPPDPAATPTPAAAEAAEWEGESWDEPTAEWIGGELRVEEFRVPAMRGTLKVPPEPQVGAAAVPVDVAVQYLAGGSARGLPVTVRGLLRDRVPEAPPELERFLFANGPVTEGVERSGDEEEDDGQPVADGVHQRRTLTLDAGGTGRTTIDAIPPSTTPRELRCELEFRDPSGQTQTVGATVPLWPAAWLPAITTDRLPADGPGDPRIAARVAVVDAAGAPVAGAPVQVDVLGRTTFSHRKRVVGGFYAWDHVVETRRLGTLCRGRTDAAGFLACDGVAPARGELVLEATVTDADGHRAAAHGSIYLPSADDWWQRVEDGDRIDLVPERRRWEPGETARFRVRMPFRQATALVAVEREGVLEARVVPLAGADPVLEVPVGDGFAPNVFVSALVVRGRVGDVQPTALVDLGKPAFKLGIAEIEVGWRAHALRVRVHAERPVHRVRDVAAVKIAVRTAAGTPAAGGEVAIAAVDEALLELWPNRSWKLLEGMMGRRAYGVATSTAQMQVVGKRHYGTKAVAPGGAGGRQPTRELFDTLLLWRGRVPLDAAGRAVVEVPLNDSLSSFRIVAVATAGLDQFGTGATSIRSTQDVMLLAGLPPVVREGDRFRAEVTARNTTDTAIALTLLPGVEGLTAPLPAITQTLPPHDARPFGWDVTVPAGTTALVWDVAATAAGAPVDRLKIRQQVRPAVPVRTLQATLVQLGAAPTHEALALPADALPGGEVRVGLAPSLVAGLEPVREWMRHYPFTCLEQRVSRAVALSDPALWAAVAAALPSFQDDAGFLKYFATQDEGSDVLTAYVLAVTQEAGLALPDDVRGKMEGALRGFVDGSVARAGPLPAADLVIRKLAALEALSRVGGVDPAAVATIPIDPTLWPTSAVLDWWSVLARVPDLPRREAALAAAENVVRTRLAVAGTRLGFSTERADGLWWLMAGPDVNAVRLVLMLVEQGRWRDEVPRLARGALGRQRAGTWESTTANAWGVLAIQRFAAAFEPGAVAGETSATLGATTALTEWDLTPAGRAFALPWPAGPSELVLRHGGGGAPWATVEARAAVPLAQPLWSGYRIGRTVEPLDVRTPGAWSVGDTLRVRLAIDADADMTWVVLSDPVPGGAQHLGTGLARDAAPAAAASPAPTGPEPLFVERPFDAFRAYWELVPQGQAHVDYVLRLNQPGRFTLPPTRVEALYAPDVYGELPNAAIEVQP